MKKKSDIEMIFLEALHGKRKARVEFYSMEDKRQIERICAPMDFGPSRRSKDQSNRFHLWDFTSDTKSHTLSLIPDQIKSIEIMPDSFDPSEFVSWKPRWFVPRDWGAYS